MTARKRAGALNSSGYVLIARAMRASGRLTGILVLARFYSVQDVAEFAFAFAIASIVGLASDLGVSEYAVRELAASKRDTSVLERRIAMLRMITLLPALLLTWSICAASDVEGVSALGAIAFALSASATDTFSALRRGHGRHDLEALECSMPMISVVAATAFAIAGSSVDVFQIALGGGALTIIGIRALVMMLRARPAESSASAPVPTIRGLIGGSRWLLGRAVVSLLLFEIGVVLLERLSTPTELAIYALAARPVGLMMQVLAVIPLVFLPLLSRIPETQTEQMAYQTLHLNLLHIAAIPAAFAGCVIGGEVLLWISGESYTGGRPVLMLLAIGTLLYAGTLSTLPLVVLRRERVVVIASGIGVAVLVGASFVLIPSHGAMGAALAAGGGFAALKVVLVIAYRVNGLPIGTRRHLHALVASAAVLAGATWLPGMAGYAVLVSGGIVSAAATIQLLRTTRSPD